MESPPGLGTEPPCPPEPATSLIRPASWTRALPLPELFPRPAPLEVDVGCGKGRFLLARAAACPDVNFLGIDRMGKRIRKVDRKVVQRGLANVRLLQSEAFQAMECLLAPETVRAVYLFFPDPWPKRRHHRRRILGPEFLDVLHRALEPKAIVHVCTDHMDYFSAIRATFEADSRFDSVPFVDRPEEQKTDFEVVFEAAGLPIGRAAYRKRAIPIRLPSVPK